MGKISGAEMIVKTLIREECATAFGITGGAVLPLYDEIMNYEKKFRHILVRHEQGAAHAADGFARASGKPGICIATSGPGAANLVTGIMNAFMDSSPIIAFGGQVRRSLIGNDAFQETDMIGMTTPITKHNFSIMDPEKINKTIKMAIKIATQGRPGPVYIDLPVDVQKEMVEEKYHDDVEIAGFNPTIEGNPKQIKRAAEEILKAEKPVIIAGGGCLWANAAPELKELVEILNAPVAVTLMGKSVFPEQHPLYIGMLGMHGRKSANYATINCDLIVAIGCRFSDRITGNLQTFAKKARVIHIDIDPAEIGKNVPVDVPIVGDAKKILAELVKEIKKSVGSRSKAQNAWAEKLKECTRLCECGKSKDEKIDPRNVIMELNRVLKEDDIVVTGVGQHQMYAAHFLKRSKPRTFISSGGAGTMGFGLPAAMGAKVARPNANVFDVDGDGSFQMTMQELGTLAAENIKVIPVIVNNEYLGMPRQWLEIFWNKRYSNIYLGKLPNYVKIAEAYGFQAVEVTRDSQLEGAFKEALRAKETTIIDVKVNPDANILPMFPSGGNLTDIFGPCVPEKGRLF